MRGKGKPCRKPCTCQWITPAYAGKSVFSWVCENKWKGSPPPMRGKVKVLLVEFVVRGITPAYAGKRL